MKRKKSDIKVLIISSKNPLNNQLVRLTGDGYNDINFKGSAAKYRLLIHKKTGRKFTVLNDENYKYVKKIFKNMSEYVEFVKWYNSRKKRK